ncbi:hypothetical protein D3C73_1383710 [compost metagenome]
MQADIGYMLLAAGVRTADKMNPQLFIQLQPLIEIFGYIYRPLFGFYECQITELIASAGYSAAEERLCFRR